MSENLIPLRPDIDLVSEKFPMVCAFVGKSGCGKTTMANKLRTLPGFDSAIVCESGSPMCIPGYLRPHIDFLFIFKSTSFRDYPIFDAYHSFSEEKFEKLLDSLNPYEALVVPMQSKTLKTYRVQI